MNKKTVFLIAFLLVAFISTVSLAQETSEEGACVSSYECGPWSEECEGGLRTRTCIDTTCGRRDLLERSFCEDPDSKCTPKIECGPWSSCEYTGRTDRLLEGKIDFEGTRRRVCRDTNNCGIPSFYQESPCSTQFDLKLSPGRECEQNILKVIDPGSDQTIAKINLDRWKQNKFDLAFVQGEIQYCPSCYDTVKNNDETGVDCGGSCKPCKTETAILRYLFILFLWSGSAVFTFLSVRQYATSKKQESVFIEGQWPR
jgi:hypothetical protein